MFALFEFVLKATVFLTGASVFAFPTVSAPSPHADIVDVGYASYLGNRSFSNTVAYLGIPYAEPPLGEKRFRAPLPLNTSRVSKSLNGQVADATKYPDFCIQGTTGSGDAGGAGSEDCLKVNIYAPVGVTKNIPVLVYIHGGGYVYGNPTNFPFDHWIHQSPNVVIVSVYYRLDSLGFLTVSEFSDPANGDFNAGFLDQRLALRWINQYIGAFGGDPDRVTINGQSAGGSSVELHLVAKANGNEKLFSGAIAQSVDRTPLPTPEQQKPLFDFFAQQAGCGNGTVMEQLACLRKVSVSAIARAQDASSSSAFNGLYNGFHPIVDGKIITDLPTKSILSRQFARVPLIVGSTSNETVSFFGSDIATSLKAFFPGLASSDIDEYLTEYPSTDFTSEEQRFQVITGESELICARSIMGGAFARALPQKVWTYRYNQPNPTLGSEAVTHAAENWMMFIGVNTGFNGTATFTPQTPVEQAFAQELIAYWLSFVRSGNPNTYRLGRAHSWPSYTTLGKLRIVLQQDAKNWTAVSGSYTEREPQDESARCRFVAGKVEHTQN